MKNSLLIFAAGILLVVPLALRGQNKNVVNNKLARAISTTINGSNWMKFNIDQKLSAASVINDNKSAFGLSVNDEVRILRTETDGLGMTHYRFGQFFRSIPVEGAEYIIHTRNGVAISANGRLVKGINVDVTPAFPKTQAFQTAMQYINAKHYLWEDKETEKLLKIARKDSTATFYPNPELVIVTKDIAGIDTDYRLAYKVELFADEPLTGKAIYIDAHTGEVLSTLELIHTGDVQATAVTKYSGNRTITTDSVSPTLYRLRETGRAQGIQTYNMHNQISYGTALDFFDTDNYWNNTNAAQDEAATDAHWAIEMTHDYYLQKHNRSSFDNKGSLMMIFVHYYAGYVNAFWNGYWMTFGDGDATYKALTALDISGHELTHGVTQNSAGLMYQGESGALNESFSDVFGTSIEFFAKPATANWTIAEDIGPIFRSMSNPKVKSNPDTYRGQYWVSGSSDYGGVHTNSGVQNYWFYLLSVGGADTNDLGHAFNVTAIGMDKAAQIAYRNLTVYLSKTSQYIDARQGSIWAAEDLFGVCSPEAIQTANAWYAVGVGNPVSNEDVGLLKVFVSGGCGLNNSENISVLVRNNGCVPLTTGDTLFVTHRLDKTFINTDTLLISSSIAPGDSLNYNFTKKLDLSVLGMHTIDAWVRHKGDTLQFNDSIKNVNIENKLFQNTDVAIVSIASPKADCQLGNNETITAKIRFNGCDSLPANEKIVLAYRINKGAVTKDTMVLAKKALPNDTLIFSFKKKVDLSARQPYFFDCWVDHKNDAIHTNDTISNFRINSPYYTSNKVITFEDSASVVDSFYVVTNPQSSVYVSRSAARTPLSSGGHFGFRMTGGNWLANRWSYKTPMDVNEWTVNDDFSAYICFCVDATSWAKAFLRFDSRQTYNRTLTNLTGVANPYTSNMRILINGIQIGNSYDAKTVKYSQWATHSVNLSSYAGSAFTVCFQTKNYVDVKYETVANPQGDNAFLDNIYLGEDSIINVGVAENNSSENIFEIYPNPGNDKFTISYSASQTEIINIKLLDVLGRVLIDINRNTIVGENRIQLETPGLPVGVYTIRLLTGNGSGVRRVIIE
jgi:Zn-dependent metalloprotease